MTVSVELEAVGFGLKENVAPAGSPLALRETWPLKPPLGTTETPYETLPPWATVRLDGEAESEKSPPPDGITSVAVVEATRAPLTPCTVMV